MLKSAVIGLIAGIAFTLAFLATARPEPLPACSLALVLAMDVSGSVDDDEYRLQRDGTAEAFRSPQIASIIEREGGVAVTVLEWGDWASTTVPWTVLHTAEDATAFADALAATRRSGRGATHLGAALYAAKNALDRAPCEADREVIDVSTDGPPNDHFEQWRGELLERGTVINILAVPDTQRAWLPEWLRENVVSPGGFLIEARGYEAFGPAIRKKLSLELAMYR